MENLHSPQNKPENASLCSSLGKQRDDVAVPCARSKHKSYPTKYRTTLDPRSIQVQSPPLDTTNEPKELEFEDLFGTLTLTQCSEFENLRLTSELIKVSGDVSPSLQLTISTATAAIAGEPRRRRAANWQRLELGSEREREKEERFRPRLVPTGCGLVWS